jgi:hypothetical protein
VRSETYYIVVLRQNLAVVFNFLCTPAYKGAKFEHICAMRAEAPSLVSLALSWMTSPPLPVMPLFWGCFGGRMCTLCVSGGLVNGRGAAVYGGYKWEASSLDSP